MGDRRRSGGRPVRMKRALSHRACTERSTVSEDIPIDASPFSIETIGHGLTFESSWMSKILGDHA